MKPDDITNDEAYAAWDAGDCDMRSLTHALAAQNALRDQRVAAEAARAERERADRLEAALREIADEEEIRPYVQYRMREVARAALRGEGDAPDPAPCPDCRDSLGIVVACSSCGGTGHTPTKEKR